VDAWSDHFASNGWRVSGRTADWGYRPDVPEGVCAVRGALRVAGRRRDGGGGVRARWRSSRGPARLGPIAAPPVRYVAANLFAEPGPRFPRRASRRVTSKGVDPPCRRHGWTDQTWQAKKSGRLFVFTPQNVDSRHPFLAISLALRPQAATLSSGACPRARDHDLPSGVDVSAPTACRLKRLPPTTARPRDRLPWPPRP